MGTLLKRQILHHYTTQLYVREESECVRKMLVTKLCFFLWNCSAVCLLWLFLLYSTTYYTDCFQILPLPYISLPKWPIFLKQNSSCDSLTQQETQLRDSSARLASLLNMATFYLLDIIILITTIIIILPSEFTTITQSNTEAHKHHSLTHTMPAKG